MYDEEFENALKESDGDMEYAAFAEHHHFIVPKIAHWNKVREKIPMWGRPYKMPCVKLKQQTPVRCMVFLAMQVGLTKTDFRMLRLLI